MRLAELIPDFDFAAAKSQAALAYLEIQTTLQKKRDGEFEYEMVDEDEEKSASEPVKETDAEESTGSDSKA